MERRNSIRAAIQGLLTQPQDSDEQSIGIGLRQASGASGFTSVRAVSCTCSSVGDASIFNEIQAELREYGISAESGEIARAVLEAVSTRPALCRGLFSEYLLNE